MSQTVDVRSEPLCVPGPSVLWIWALHVDLRDHRPAPHELAQWTDQARGGASHRELAAQFLRSPGYCRHQVATLYRGLLDRDGDPAGLDAWTASLEAGAPLQNVVTGLCDSAEYRSRHTLPGSFVESLYQRLLGRAPDAAGKAGWLRVLDNGASTLSVIQGFVRSTEYCAQRLTELHVRLLGREPERRGLLRWIVAAAQGTALQHFVLELVTSVEYIARAAGRDSGPPAGHSNEPGGEPRPSGGGAVAARARRLTPRPAPGRSAAGAGYRGRHEVLRQLRYGPPAASLPPMCTR